MKRRFNLPAWARECCDKERMIVSFRPGPPLDAHVEVIWAYDGQATQTSRETVLPNGKMQLSIDLSTGDGMVCGVRTCRSVIDTAVIRPVMGVVFRPGGARGLFDAAGDDFLNKIVPLDQIWDGRAAELRDRILEAGAIDQQLQVLEESLVSAIRRAGDRTALHPAVRYSLGQLRRSPDIPSVLGLAREVGLSRRRFGQLFSEQVGATPKFYCRLRRFLGVVRTIAAGEPVNWADMAVGAGYADQAHLIHEFQEFAGLSPGRYQAAERPHRYHVRTG